MISLDGLDGRVEELREYRRGLETDILGYFYHMCRLQDTARAASMLDPALFSGEGRDLAQAMLECFGKAAAGGAMVLRSSIDDVLARDGKSYDTRQLGGLSDLSIPGIETLRVRIGELRDVSTRLAKCEVLAGELRRGVIEQGGSFSPDIGERLSGAEAGNPEDTRITPQAADAFLDDLIRERADPDALRFGYGYEKLDRFTGGMYRGGVNVVMARPGERKTQLMTNVLANSLRAGRGMRVAVFSLEMPKKRIYFRTLLAASGIGRRVSDYLDPRSDFGGTMSEEARGKAERVAALFGSTEVNLLDMNDFEMNVNSIIAWLERQCTAGRQPDLVMLDYFQIIPPDPGLAGKPVHEQLADISRKLTGFCNRHPRCAVLLLAQARRSEGGKDRRVYPTLDDVAGCDQLARDAWQVISLFRGRGGRCGLEVLKNRDGSTGYARLFVMDEQQKLDIDGDFSFGSPLPGMFDEAQGLEGAEDLEPRKYTGRR